MIRIMLGRNVVAFMLLIYPVTQVAANGTEGDHTKPYELSHFCLGNGVIDMNLRINEPFYEVHSVSSTKVLNRTCGTRADKDAEDTVRLQIAGGDSSGKIVRGVITMKNSEACGIETTVDSEGRIVGTSWTLVVRRNENIITKRDSFISIVCNISSEVNVTATIPSTWDGANRTIAPPDNVLMTIVNARDEKLTALDKTTIGDRIAMKISFNRMEWTDLGIKVKRCVIYPKRFPEKYIQLIDDGFTIANEDLSLAANEQFEAKDEGVVSPPFDAIVFTDDKDIVYRCTAAICKKENNCVVSCDRHQDSLHSGEQAVGAENKSMFTDNDELFHPNQVNDRAGVTQFDPPWIHLPQPKFDVKLPHIFMVYLTLLVTAFAVAKWCDRYPF